MSKKPYRHKIRLADGKEAEKIPALGMTIVRGNRIDPDSTEMKADLPENDRRQDEAQRQKSGIGSCLQIIRGSKPSA